MIISSAPLRVSFFGGGSDYPDYFEKNTGAVLSTAINKRIFVSVHRTNSISRARYILTYSKIEEVDKIEEIQHPAVRRILQHLDIDFGLEITIVSELPARSGLGSSSTFVVALLAALYRLMDVQKSNFEIAMDAIHIEQEVIGDLVGCQDQVAAAVGGMNRINFNRDRSIDVLPLKVEKETVQNLFDCLFLCFSNQLRFANEITKDQISRIKAGDADECTRQLVALVDIAEQQLLARDVEAFAFNMNKAWQLKREISGKISNVHIDTMYDDAIEHGAIGGKLLGAGGGGFFLFYVPKERQLSFEHHFESRALLKIRPEPSGVKVLEI